MGIWNGGQDFSRLAKGLLTNSKTIAQAVSASPLFTVINGIRTTMQFFWEIPNPRMRQSATRPFSQSAILDATKLRSEPSQVSDFVFDSLQMIVRNAIRSLRISCLTQPRDAEDHATRKGVKRRKSVEQLSTPSTPAIGELYKFGRLRGCAEVLCAEEVWLRRPDTYRI